MKKLGIVLRSVIAFAVIALSYWFTLPPLNAKSASFWRFLVWCAIVVFAVFFAGKWLRRILSGEVSAPRVFVRGASRPQIPSPMKIVLGCVAALLLFWIGTGIVGMPLFNAAKYENLLTVADGNFAKDVTELSMSQIPVVDRDTAATLGKRKLGEMSDLVSQFEIASDYTQINVNDVPVRVTPLLYGDPIKWLNNHKAGIPGYLSVDMTTQEVTLVRLENGIRYSESEYFMRYIPRYLRFRYPLEIFGNISFEVNDDGTPFWVASTVKYRIGFRSGTDIDGVVLVNAVTGECEKYDVGNVPTWVDQVYDSELILAQLTYNGEYRSGYWNSIFGQKGVLAPTAGYNYLALDDDVWLYTGMTSVVSDESNVGFVLVNLRTKETRYYAVPGAEEFSAMSSAEGQVQHLGYGATFPILLNVGDRPTYFMSLKDAAGLVKMYAFVDVQQYQVVATGNTVKEARDAYLVRLKEEGKIDSGTEETEPPQVTVVSGTVARVGTAVVDGDSVYYIALTDGTVLSASIRLSDRLPFLAWGDTVTATLTDGAVTELKIELQFVA